MCNQLLTTMMMNNDYGEGHDDGGDNDTGDHALVSICQMAEGWSWSLGLLVGIVALRALEARYLPPCALLCHTARQILLLCPFLLI